MHNRTRNAVEARSIKRGLSAHQISEGVDCNKSIIPTRKEHRCELKK